MFYSVAANRRRPNLYIIYIYREGGGRIHLLLALLIRPLATHPFRDGVTFPLLQQVASSLPQYFVSMYHRKKNPPWSFAACGHHLSPGTAIVLALLSSVPGEFLAACACWDFNWPDAGEMSANKKKCRVPDESTMNTRI